MTTDNRANKAEVWILDYGDFETMVKEEWPAWKPNPKIRFDDGYSFPADEECGNDTCKMYRVSNEPARKFDEEDIEKFALRVKGNTPMYMAGRLLDEMCRRRVIEPGKYFIEISW